MVILVSPKTPAHSLELRFVVITTLVPLVELAEQVEQQGTAGGAERQVTEFVEDDDVQAAQTVGELSDLTLRLLLFESVDQFDGREESDLLAMMFDRLDADCRGDMGLASARTRR